MMALTCSVLKLPKNHFKDAKKVADFPYVRGGRVGQPTYGKFHMFFCNYFLEASLIESRSDSALVYSQLY